MGHSPPTSPVRRLPPTTPALLDDTARPYFLWWTDTTVGQLKEHLAADDPEERAYWMGSLLREANTRDVWLFVRSDEIRALWPRLIRYLGRSRQMWAWLLELPPPEWPPLSEIRAGHAPHLGPVGDVRETPVILESAALFSVDEALTTSERWRRRLAGQMTSDSADLLCEDRDR